MAKKILLALLAIVAVFLVVVSMQPDDFSVTRSATFDAPSQTVFAHVNDLGKWEAWSPWAKMDPEAETEFEGPEAGTGAIMRWKGEKTGQGSMTIVESRPGEFVGFDLAFIKPFESSSAASFTFEPDGGRTRVTWTMEGKSNFIGKAMGLFMNCDKMVGDQFDEGLASLKEIVEQG
ncbi:MAG: polyketide cyclase [Alphaproteobacteria bacterium]|nr:polyketide cyclase [Alphaproteobacteria bacterium]